MKHRFASFVVVILATFLLFGCRLGVGISSKDNTRSTPTASQPTTGFADHGKEEEQAKTPRLCASMRAFAPMVEDKNSVNQTDFDQAKKEFADALAEDIKKRPRARLRGCDTSEPDDEKTSVSLGLSVFVEHLDRATVLQVVGPELEDIKRDLAGAQFRAGRQLLRLTATAWKLTEAELLKAGFTKQQLEEADVEFPEPKKPDGTAP